MSPAPVIGLIAGNGSLPRLFARAARARGLSVVAAAHTGETDPGLAAEVDALTWVRVGQVARIQRVLRAAGVREAVLAGGFRRVRALAELRPDRGLLRVAARLRSVRDDALLRAVAAEFEAGGIHIVSPIPYLDELLAPVGLLAGPALDDDVRRDVALGTEVAAALGRADVGQTVVVRSGHVLALEAVEGTDACIRRGAALGGRGVVVVKRLKPGQDERFDLPAVGPGTVEVLAEVGARALAVEAGKTLLLDAGRLLGLAERAGISVVGVEPSAGAALRPPGG
ncbi:MAG TPA: UDP-2,3-diacylglucosamine diphosphatase LpxI [Myxococcaceae bacterium]|nr:UDP-2,3-diacylglucosamine diphosphatase LpxI [Myxococcaceae bacterium]